jgi:capsular polysaccharide export protein
MSLSAPAFPWARVDLGDAARGWQSPFTGEKITAAAAAAIVADWHRIDAANRPIMVASGMAWWKRAQIARFLWASGRASLAFEDTTPGALAKAGAGTIAAWPSRMPAGLDAAAGDRLVRVEDGFIRSIGLGADLHPPLSIVVDAQGIYYDPTRPSELETILETTDFTPDLLARAEALIATIVTRGISKYASAGPIAPAAPRARRTVLVTGQVEDDMSVRLGGAGVAGNLDLLRRARAAEPDALLLFKPHPDVDAGHRIGRVPDSALLAHADQIVRGESMPSLLSRVDAVHVLTSLTGFEALLRGLEVTVHGHPFFAGWGLTRDLAGPLPRRTRRLSLAQLVAGTLILYPRYLDPVSGLWCPPEILLRRFAEGWRPRPTWLIRARRLQGRIARAFGTVSR